MAYLCAHRHTHTHTYCILVSVGYRIVSFRNKRYDTMRYARPTIRYDTIRHDASTIRNDTRYDTPKNGDDTYRSYRSHRIVSSNSAKNTGATFSALLCLFEHFPLFLCLPQNSARFWFCLFLL
eukprot:GEMP01058174.1.p1 GENE.GEMP01058174.1~~GEMP01058174.1.p1  ORF type:complete len:123 (-),score=3.34 GEMP01058174.1:87-455(-)